MTKVLFVLKYRETPSYGNSSYSEGYNGCGGWGDGTGKFLSSGLYNSANFVNEMLQRNGIHSKLVHVVDNNKIHKEIVEYGKEFGGPVTHVIIEAFWVVPEKFIELHKVLPHVKWIIRNHSETPFLANEGMAFDWTLKYIDLPNVSISCNAPRMLKETRLLVKEIHPEWNHNEIEEKVPFLPNFYPLDGYQIHKPKRDDGYIDVGCFGAVRPLKNHIVQAIAAIKFATLQRKKLRFHINSGRVEMNASPVLRNLRSIFNRYPHHELIEHPWKPHEDFKKLLKGMDIVSQVSFSETFNIVAADAVSQGIPIVASKEIPWVSNMFYADPTSSEDICRVMERAYAVKQFWWNLNLNLWGLKKSNENAKRIWLRFFKTSYFQRKLF